jgi:hypothetical protein
MLRFLCLLLLLSGSVYGQTPADSSLIDPMLLAYKPPQRTVADTIQALHLLFVNKRVGGGLVVALGGISLIATPAIYIASAGPTTSTYGYLGDAIGGTMVGLAISIPVNALGIYLLSGNSKNRENEVIHDYTERHILPKKIKRKLKPSLFLPLNFPTINR